jgi:hypothetical protein
MGLSAALACITGTKRAARYAAELHERGAELAKRARDDDLIVEGPTGRTLCALFLGQPREVLEHAAAADRAYAIQNFADGHGDYYYMYAVHAARLTALNALGRHSEAREELASYLARANATGNRTAVLQATLSRTFVERVTDNCATSRARLDAERPELPKAGFGVLHVAHLIATMHAACATGDYAWALDRLAEDWPTFLRATIHRTAYIAAAAHSAHSRLMMNYHVVRRDGSDPSRAMRADLRALARLPASAFRDGVVLRVRARCAYLSGDVAGAINLLERSAKAWNEAGVADEVHREHFAIACIRGGDEGVQMSTTALSKLRALGVRVPLEEFRGYYPELFDAGLVERLGCH